MAEELTEGGEGVATVEGQPPVADPPTEAMPPEGAAHADPSVPPPAEPSVPPPAEPSVPPSAAEPSVPPMPAGEPEVSAPPPAASVAPAGGKKKRRKIDLKSRLSSVRASGSMAKAGPSDRKSDPLSFPPPPASSVPAPKIGAISSSPLISSAFAPPEPEKKPTAQQQTIKVEVGEEIVQERKKASKRTAVLVAIGALVAGGLGFAIGGVQARGAFASKAKDGSKQLAENVDAANAELTKLSDGLRKANETIGIGEYPAELVELLKTTNVPFDAEMMKGKNVGQLPALAFNKLLAFSEGAQRVNDQKDELRKKLEAAKKPIETRIADSKAPKYKFGVIFTKKTDEKKNDYFLAEILPLKTEIEQSTEEWPSELTLMQGKGKKPDERKEVAGVPWSGKGKIAEGENKPVIVVGGESTAPPATPEGIKVDLQLQRMLTALRDMRILIDGNPSPNPSLQSDGLIKTGEILSEELKKVYNR